MTKILLFDIKPYYKVQIYENGDVKIFSNSPHKKGKELSIHKNMYGYLKVKIKNKPIKIHKLIVDHFLGPSNGLCINHIDGNKLNNHPKNLEYVTISDNIKHAIALGLHVSNNPSRSGRYKDGRTINRIKDYKHEWYIKNKERILAKRKRVKL